MHSNPFTDEELNQRLKKTKTLMESNIADLHENLISEIEKKYSAKQKK